jgi:hypothetical protein
MALLLGRHYEFPQCGTIKGKLLLLLLVNMPPCAKPIAKFRIAARLKLPLLKVSHTTNQSAEKAEILTDSPPSPHTHPKLQTERGYQNLE